MRYILIGRGLKICAAMCGALLMVGQASLAGTDSSVLAARGYGVNAVNGMQEREEVFEFVRKPAVIRQQSGGADAKSDGIQITFATKAACDVTVAITGPDGKVVRHLASGVLGRNAPWPLQQDTLSQKLEWDGKDDDGKPAPAGCKVKVMLGLDAKFEKLEAWSLLSGIRPLAVGKDGELYAASAGLTGAIHVFGKDGKYLRTMFPPSSVMEAGKKFSPDDVAAIAWNKTTKGDFAPRRHRNGGGFDFELTKYAAFFGCISAGAVTGNGKLCLLYSDKNGGASLLIMEVRDGSCPAGGIVNLGRIATDGMAASPDGRWLYFAGRPPNLKEKSKPFSHAIMRTSLVKPDKPEVFIGELAKAGDDTAHFSGPNRVACDKDGNLYVNDQGNARIQVFKPDGTYLKTLAGITGLFGVSQTTGAIFLWQQKSWTQNPIFTKLTSLDNPAKAAEFTIQGPGGGQWRDGQQSAILSGAAEPAVAWFAGASYKGTPLVTAIEDRGGSLVTTVDLLKANDTPSSGADVTSPGMWTTLHADRRAGTLGYEPVDAMGRVYRRIQFWSGPPAGTPDNKMWIVRYDPVAKKYVSFEQGDASGAPNGFLNPYAPLLQDGKPVIGLPMYYSRGAHHHQGPFCVAPNGDIYVGATYASQYNDEMDKAGLPKLQPKRLANICAPSIRVYGPDGKLKTPNALPGLAELEGLRVGRSGAIYVVQPWHTAGQKVPEGLAEGSSYEGSRWAGLIKFAGNFEKFPLGRVEGAWEPTPAGVSHEGAGMKVKISGAQWTYNGVSPHSALYSACTCMKASADLDDYERSFVCAAQTCSINVIDANGNVLARLGGYGNIDDLMSGKKLTFCLPRNVAATDDTMWVADIDYKALVRTRLVYRAAEVAGIE